LNDIASSLPEMSAPPVENFANMVTAVKIARRTDGIIRERIRNGSRYSAKCGVKNFFQCLNVDWMVQCE
jgi:hypothetical protein